MKWSNSKTVLVIVGLVLAALVLRYLPGSHAPNKDVRKELSALCDEYAALCERGAGELQWKDFDEKSRRHTAAFIADFEKTKSHDREANRSLYFLAKFDLPKAVASQGKVPVETLRQPLVALENQELKARRAKPGVDFVTVGLLVVDGVLLAWLGYLFVPWVKSTVLSHKGNAEVMLHQLDELIARHPDSARHRGIRAKKLAETGRFDDAIAEVDWILTHHPVGANLDEWRRWREAVVQKAKAEG